MTRYVLMAIAVACVVAFIGIIISVSFTAENDAVISRCQAIATEKKKPMTPCGFTSTQLDADAQAKRDRQEATRREKKALEILEAGQ